MIIERRRAITSGDVAKYMLLPGILPWLRRFGKQLSGMFFIFTQIFGATRLIDPMHPCLRIENRHLYSFTDVLLLAWHNLEFSRRNLSQILMFFAVVLSALLLIGIIAAGLIQLFLNFGTAHAQYFSTPNTSIPYDVNNDWAFQFLERVFGGSLNTGVNFWIQTETTGVSSSGNLWLSGIFAGMLKAYSQALMVIASFMVIYMVVITLADAARTGQPFGEKFDGIWAPIRFALALGMLVPFSGAGYNGAQLVVFQAAEMGSNLATNLWHRALESADNCDGENANSSHCKFLTTPTTDYGYKFLRDVFLVNLCVYGYNAAIQEGEITDLNALINEYKVSVNGDYETYVFGSKDARSFCGEVILPRPMDTSDIPPGFLSDTSSLGSGTVLGSETLGYFAGVPGASGSNSTSDYLPLVISHGYNQGAKRFLPFVGGGMDVVAKEFAKDAFCKHDQALGDIKCGEDSCSIHAVDWIKKYWIHAMGRHNGDLQLSDRFFQAYDDQVDIYNKWIFEALKKDARYGWATAGVFYLRLSNAISDVSKAISNVPQVKTLPVNYTRKYATPSFPALEDSAAKDACGDGVFKIEADFCAGADAAVTVNILLKKGVSWFRTAPQTADPNFYATLNPTLYETSLRVADPDSSVSPDPQSQISPITEMIFEYIRFGDGDMNPLGTVISWGDGMFTIASWSYTLSIAMSLLSKVPFIGPVMGLLAPLLKFIGDVFVIPGFVLLFVVPFLPFLYFTFAVVEWIASIVEAIIGVPLWVLTWIRRDGDLLGPAMEGIKMLFEIILRPTIIVFSLVVSIILFSASLIFFENAIKLYMGVYSEQVMSNSPSLMSGVNNALTGVGVILVYVFSVYSLATSSFKLIELIPNAFGRWLEIGGGFGSMVNMGSMMDPMAAAMVATTAVRTASAVTSDANKMAANLSAQIWPDKDNNKKKKEDDPDLEPDGGGPKPPRGGPSGSMPLGLGAGSGGAGASGTGGGPAGGGAPTGSGGWTSSSTGGMGGGWTGNNTAGGSTSSGGGYQNNHFGGRTGNMGSGESQQNSGQSSSPSPKADRSKFVAPTWEGFSILNMQKMTMEERAAHTSDAFKILGITDPHASKDDIHKAYRAKLREVRKQDHTDSNEAVQEEAKKIAGYYDLLKYIKGF